MFHLQNLRPDTKSIDKTPFLDNNNKNKTLKYISFSYKINLKNMNNIKLINRLTKNQFKKIYILIIEKIR